MTRVRFEPPLEDPIKALHKHANKALGKAAEHVLAESNKMVPLEEGTLQRSGVADTDTDKRLTASVSYNTPYAARQHEELSYQHDAGRRAKFLELALVNSQQEVLKIIADEINKET